MVNFKIHDKAGTEKRWPPTGSSIEKRVNISETCNILKLLPLSLEWERKIPEDAINSLKAVMAGDDFNEKLPEVINKINQLSYKTFNDLPRGEVTTG